jgi:hypothetical protein
MTEFLEVTGEVLYELVQAAPVSSIRLLRYDESGAYWQIAGKVYHIA